MLKALPPLSLLGLLVCALAGCGGGEETGPVSPAAVVKAGQSWLGVNDFLYQLQGLNLTQAGASKFDLIVTDYSRDGSAAAEWKPAQIKALRNSAGGPKLVLAYLSIGEAEDYRFYWKPAWKPGNPAWLGKPNPDWPGNYRVKYWDPAWQAIIFGQPGAYLDRIMAQGFSGVYLDLVDAYELYPNRPTARAEMIAFVKALSAYAKARRPGFKIMPQNASGLLKTPGYLAAIDGIGQEELSFGWDGANGVATPVAVRNAITQNLKLATAAGKLVLVVDYTRKPAQINTAYAYCAANGFVDYCTVRDLDQMTINAGHEPD